MAKLIVLTGPRGVGKLYLSKMIGNYSKEKIAIIDKDTLINLQPKQDNDKKVYNENLLFLINNFIKNDYNVIYTDDLHEEEYIDLKEKLKDIEVKLYVLISDKQTLKLRNLTDRNYDLEKSLIQLQFYNDTYLNERKLDVTDYSILDLTNLLIKENNL